MLVKQKVHREQILKNIQDKETDDLEKLEENMDRITNRFKNTKDNYFDILNERKQKLSLENIGIDNRIKQFRQ